MSASEADMLRAMIETQREQLNLNRALAAATLVMSDALATLVRACPEETRRVVLERLGRPPEAFIVPSLIGASEQALPEIAEAAAALARQIIPASA
jgi:hypothetical protein